ncbi:MAG: histidine phosphatase family protein [Candidatus Baltobacteraceae bacterium]
MDLLFVRHGSTRWNGERRFQGQTDVPLDEPGRAQARALARTLHSEAFGRIVSSDLQRALETARAIAGPRTVEAEPRWREFAFGAWEGRTVDEVDSGINPRLYAPPGGETFEHVRARVREALDGIGTGPGRVLIVTHAGPLHAMLDLLFGEVPFRFEPASLTQVRRGARGAKLLSLGVSAEQYAALLPLR